MAVTNVRGRQLRDDDVTRADLNTTVSGSAVVRQVFSGTGLTQSQTGVDTGTGDVTLSLSTSGVSAGTYGSSTIIPVITVDAYGRVTNVNTATVSGGGGGGGSSVRCEQTFTATANQTLIEGLTCALTAGYFDVFINGVKVNASSFTNTSTTITFTDGLAAGDIVDVVNYGIFSTSVTAANGFTGTVQNATTTPEITLSTSVTGIIKGSGGSLVAAVAGTDYQAPISLTTTGSSGAASFSSNILNIPNYTLAGLGGQPLATNLTSLAGLTYASTSFVKMTAAGTFALDTNTYYLASNPSGYTNNTGTVTSVAALTIGTTGTDITSSVATGTTTPVITLNIPDASATARGVVTTGTQTFAGSKYFNSAPFIPSFVEGRILTVGVGGVLVDNTSFIYTATAPLYTKTLTLGDAITDAQFKFNYGATKGGDFTAQRQGVDQLSFGFNNSGSFGGTAGADSGRLMYFYDRVSAVYIGAATATNFYIGPTSTNYGLNVARPNGSVAGVTIKATGQVQFNTYTSTTSFTGTAVGYLAFTSTGDLITVAAGSGTVTSVALSLPAIFTVSGSPVTTSGTLSATLASQTANTIFAAPNGTAGAPTFRTLVAADIPSLDTAKITTGTFGVDRGGTGAATLTGVLVGNGTSAITGVTGTASQLLRRNAGDTAYEFFTHDFASTAGATFTGQIISTRANNTANGAGQIFLNGTTGNRIDFAAVGSSNPAFTTRSAGTKIVFNPTLSGTALDYAIGIASNTLWLSLANATEVTSFRIFAANVSASVFTVTGAGNVFITSNLTVEGTGNFGIGVNAKLGSALSMYNSDDASFVQTYSTGSTTTATYNWYHSPSTRTATWAWNANTANRTYTLPDATGTIPISVNGVTANAAGDITLNTFLPLAGGTLTGALNTTTITTSGDVIITGTTAGSIEFYPAGGSTATYSVLKARLGSGLAPTLAFYGDVGGSYRGYGIYGADSTYDGLLVYRETTSVVDVIFMGMNQVSLPANQKIAWANSGNSVGTLDLGLSRNAAGVLEVNNGTAGTPASLRFLGATVTGLAGSGTRMVVADSNGVLSTQAIPSGGGGGAYTTTSQTANYTETATSGTKIIFCDTTSAAFTVTLPTAVGNTATLIVKKTAGANLLTVDGDGTETIDGGLTAELYKEQESITLISNNTNWFII